MTREKKGLPKKEWRIKTKALSEDVVFAEILSRLPVRSLMRFKCVSKSWLTRISVDSSFADAHFLNHQPNSKDDPLVIVVRHDSDDKEYNYRFKLLRKIKFPAQKAWVLYDRLAKAKKLDTSNVLAANDRVTILGSCHGLVCLISLHSIMLWNPATRQVRKFPPAPQSPSMRLGFGFDATKRDFKVVRLMVKGSENAPVMCTEVLDRRGGVWRGGDEKSGVPVEKGVFLAWHVAAYGALHWLAYWGRHKKVLSFDLHDETLRVADVPAGAVQGALFLWNGLLAACTFIYEEGMSIVWAATPSDGGLCWGKVWEFKGHSSQVWIDQFTVVRKRYGTLGGDMLHCEDYRFNPSRCQPVHDEELNSNVDGLCNYVESIVSVF